MKALHGLAAAALLLGGCAAAPRAEQQAGPIPGTLLVGGGSFTMGRDSGELALRPAHRVDLDTFAIDRTEVPAARFAEFLNAAGNAGEAYVTPDDNATVVLVREGGAIRFAARPGYERFPANNVSWHGADAYCRSRGQRLPTEAEWEKAARGTDRRRFPWGGRKPGAALARFAQRWEERGLDTFVPVDALPDGASPYGALNMAGNALEWVADWYRQRLSEADGPEGGANLSLVREIVGRNGSPGGEAASQRQETARVNPTGPAEGSFRVLRGGSWRDESEAAITTTRRYWLDPTQRFPHTGFRCAVSVAEVKR